MEKEYIERIVEVEQRSKSNTKRIDDCDKRLDTLEENTAILQKMDYRMGNVESNVEKINKKLDEKSKEKGLKWDKLIDYLFYAAIAYALVKLGLK